jgi:hypothetical protein
VCPSNYVKFIRRVAILYTKNAKQIENSIIPALERELAGARARKDDETAALIEQEIVRAKKLAGIPVKEKAQKNAPEKNTQDKTGGQEKTDDTEKTDK